MADRTALVTGATGYLGAALVPALVADDWEVRATGRRPRADAAWLADGVDYAPADLAGHDDLASLLDGVTTVFHLAGASSSTSDQAEMDRTNVSGTGRLVAAAARASGVERFVHMSSTSVYGEDRQLPLPVREDVDVHPSRGYGKAKWGAEGRVWAAGRDGLAVVVLRPVSVYGPRAVKLVASAILDVAVERRAGVPRVAVHREPVEQRLLHVDDLVAATVHVASSDAAVGRAFNVTSGVYPTSIEVAAALAEEFGMELEESDDPECGLPHERRVAVREQMLADGMEPHILLTPQRFRFLAKANRNNRLSLDALESTGFRPRHTDTREGIAGAVAWYREHRWVL
ncbi:MAG: NAD-dependent epimerase/dehydratase family protein [Acidimicrobiales bacterium]